MFNFIVAYSIVTILTIQVSIFILLLLLSIHRLYHANPLSWHFMFLAFFYFQFLSFYPPPSLSLPISFYCSILSYLTLPFQFYLSEECSQASLLFSTSTSTSPTFAMKLSFGYCFLHFHFHYLPISSIFHPFLPHSQIFSSNPPPKDTDITNTFFHTTYLQYTYDIVYPSQPSLLPYFVEFLKLFCQLNLS